MKLRDLPLASRPREKAKKEGISSLSDSELLALLLGNGYAGKDVLELAEEILTTYHDFATLSTLTGADFRKIKGISIAKAERLSAAFEVARRNERRQPYTNPLDPQEIFNHYRLTLGAKKRESVVLLCFDRRGRLCQERLLFEGSEEHVSSSSRSVLSELSDPNFVSFMLLHNHPSGSVLPSPGEVTYTIDLARRAKVIGVSLQDHLILSREAYFSFRENALLIPDRKESGRRNA